LRRTYFADDATQRRERFGTDDFAGGTDRFFEGLILLAGPSWYGESGNCYENERLGHVDELPWCRFLVRVTHP
jgi:hypothetical protein